MRAEPVRETLQGVFSSSYRRLVVQLHGVVGDAAEAEDLVQEAFVRASAAGSRFRHVENPEAWLRTTAVDLHRNRWRRLRNRSAARARMDAPAGLPGPEEHVELPDFEQVVKRGHRLRRRRAAMAAGAAALGIALAGYLAGTLREPEAGRPVDGHDDVVETKPYGTGTELELEAGTYEILVGDDMTPTVAFVTLPEGWFGWRGPLRLVDDDSEASVLVLDVAEVVTRPCQPLWFGMEDVGEGPESLVRALRGMPRHQVLQPPEPDDRFGHPATHLRVRALATASCPGGEDFAVWRTDKGLIPTRPLLVTDLWVVDVEGHQVLVAAGRTPAVSPWVLAEQEDVLASVRLERGKG
jgi:DNA-directed RNA polymerase specialized sigma24 family protein